MQLFLAAVGWYSSLVSNCFLASMLAINQPVGWKSIPSLINEMYMEKAIVPMLQLLTCVQFIGFFGHFYITLLGILIPARAALCFAYETRPMRLFLAAVGWYSCLVSNSFLASKLAINQPMEWKHQLNQRFLGAVFTLYVIISTCFAICVSDNRRWHTSKGSIDTSTSKGSVATHKASII